MLDAANMYLMTKAGTEPEEKDDHVASRRPRRPRRRFCVEHQSRNRIGEVSSGAPKKEQNWRGFEA
jgi:hypothetical protein